jgi:tripartite-type tricarboxylate transporter receptor subunit TctC
MNSGAAIRAILVASRCSRSNGRNAQAGRASPSASSPRSRPGSSIDIIARLLARSHGPALGTTVVVENKVGAGGNLGVDAVSRRRRTATPSASARAARSPSIRSSSTACRTTGEGRRADRDLRQQRDRAVGTRGEPRRTLQEFIAQAKAQPGKLNYASDGVGTTNHLGGEALKSAASVDIVHVPYKGTQEALTALLQGDVQIFPRGLPPLVGQWKAGKIRPLATAMKSRDAQLPDVPDHGRSRHRRARDVRVVRDVRACRHPARRSRKIREALGRRSAKPEVRDRLVSLGITPQLSTPQDMAKLVQDEQAKWGPGDQGLEVDEDN